MTGFFGQPRGWMGLARACMGYYDQPQLMHALGEFWADFVIESSRRALEEVDVDFVQVWEDMAYNHGSLISPDLFREFMTPYYQRVTRFTREHGVDVILCDCDGNVNELVPLFLEVGVNGLYPLEIVAGTDPLAIREKFPDFLLLGGIDKIALARGPDAIDREIEKASQLMQRGGYIPFTDHRVPSDVPLANFQYYMLRKREMIGGELTPSLTELANARQEALKPPQPFTHKPQPRGPSLE